MLEEAISVSIKARHDWAHAAFEDRSDDEFVHNALKGMLMVRVFVELLCS